jgi:hypothetical protein
LNGNGLWTLITVKRTLCTVPTLGSLKVCDDSILIQLLCFWTLSIILYFFIHSTPSCGDKYYLCQLDPTEYVPSEDVSRIRCPKRCALNTNRALYNAQTCDSYTYPLWSSGQGSWLQIRRPGFDSRHYQIFWKEKKKKGKYVVGLERGPLNLVSTTEELLDKKK